jgi:hypothetical protein
MTNERGKMKTYIWDNIKDLTDSHHSSGGLVIISEKDWPIAWREHLINDGEDWTTYTKKLPQPDLVFDCNHTEERVFIFPNQGCC